MPRLALDHVVLAAFDLASGTAWAEARLGTKATPGGKHAAMGTHNALLRIGDESYLEIIAIDPDAPRPGRPRWFQLDDPEMRGRLAERPRLVTWVARATAISTAIRTGTTAIPTGETGVATGIDPGEVLTMRRGALSWQITVRPDGTMPESGLLPAIIEWPRDVHPAHALPDPGVRLERLTLIHDAPAQLLAVLAGIGARGLADARRGAAGERRLEAVLRTPAGLVLLD